MIHQQNRRTRKLIINKTLKIIYIVLEHNNPEIPLFQGQNISFLESTGHASDSLEATQCVKVAKFYNNLMSGY